LPKVISEKVISIPELKKLLEDEERRRELSSIEVVTLDYARKFSKLSPEAAEKLLNELIEQADLPPEVAVQLVNIMPKTIDEIRTILAFMKKTYLEEDLRKILVILDKYRGQ